METWTFRSIEPKKCPVLMFSLMHGLTHDQTDLKVITFLYLYWYNDLQISYKIYLTNIARLSGLLLGFCGAISFHLFLLHTTSCHWLKQPENKCKTAINMSYLFHIATMTHLSNCYNCWISCHDAWGEFVVS